MHFPKPLLSCTTIHRYPIFSTRYSVMCKVYTGYCGTSELEHGLCACTVDNPLAKARGLSLRTGAQTMLYLSLVYSRNLLYFLTKNIFIVKNLSIWIYSISKQCRTRSNCSFKVVRSGSTLYAVLSAFWPHYYTVP